MNYSYESLIYRGRLEFKDGFGLEAYFHCYQQLRVLSPELFCIVHKVWGDGDQLLRLDSPSAQLVHTFDQADKKVLLSRLATPARHGDILDIHSIRRIHHGFKSEREWWEFQPLTPTQRATVSISFPLGKDPEAIEVGGSRGSVPPYVRRPGTKELTLTVKQPTPGSTYRAEWSW